MSGVVVSGLALWAPGFDAVGRWEAQDPDPAVVRPRSDLFPGAAARRATPLTQAIAHVLVAACAEGGVAPASAALVLASCGGELEATFACLRLMLDTPPSSSPLRFAGSLHSSPLGHVSVALGARGFGSAVAAPAATLLATGLLEATTWALAHRQPVVLVVADDTWPSAPCPLVAVGVLLDVAGEGRGWLGLPRRGAGTLPTSSRAAPLRSNPASGGLDLLDALLAGVAGDVALTPPGGVGPGWTSSWRPA